MSGHWRLQEGRPRARSELCLSHRKIFLPEQLVYGAGAELRAHVREAARLRRKELRLDRALHAALHEHLGSEPR